MGRLAGFFLLIFALLNAQAPAAEPAAQPSAAASPSPFPSPLPSASPTRQAAAYSPPPTVLSTPTPAPAAQITPVPTSAAPAPVVALNRAAPIDFDHLEEATLYFKGPSGVVPRPLRTDLFELKYLGVIRPPADDPSVPPYFFFSGRSCRGCPQDPNVYALRPTGGKPSAYVYPGKIVDPRSGATVLESRAFFGRCLWRNHDPVYIVFQKERVDRRRGMLPSVLVAEPGPDHMDERLIERHMPRLQDTLRLVKAKVCFEIEGRKRRSLTRPLDINARHGVDTDEDDDDTKENQTNDELSPGR